MGGVGKVHEGQLGELKGGVVRGRPVKAPIRSFHHVFDCHMGIRERVCNSEKHGVINEAERGLTFVEGYFDQRCIVECIEYHGERATLDCAIVNVDGVQGEVIELELDFSAS